MVRVIKSYMFTNIVYFQITWISFKDNIKQHVKET
jgi:hypothetical protein